METTKRQRQTNFTANELGIIADEVQSNGDVMFAPFSSCVTNDRKKTVWNDIRDKVNACSSTVRTTEQIRKKWLDYRSQVKKKLATIKREAIKTGGGPSPSPLTEIEEKVASTIPECQVTGIPGGIETIFTATPSQPGMVTGTSAELLPVCDPEDVAIAEVTDDILSSFPVNLTEHCEERPVYKRARMSSKPELGFAERLFSLKEKKLEEEAAYRKSRKWSLSSKSVLCWSQSTPDSNSSLIHSPCLL